MNRTIDGVEYIEEEISGKGKCLVPYQNTLWDQIKENERHLYKIYDNIVISEVILVKDNHDNKFSVVILEGTFKHQLRYTYPNPLEWNKLIKQMKSDTTIKISLRES